jgi:hypothetical protein
MSAQPVSNEEALSLQLTSSSIALRARVRSEHDDAFVGVPVGDKEFVRLRIDEDVRRLPKTRRIPVGILLVAAVTDLLTTFPVA